MPAKPDNSGHNIGFRVIYEVDLPNDETESEAKPSETPRFPIAGKKQLQNDLGMQLVYCPPGELILGSPDSDSDANPNFEKPQVPAEITSGFYIGKHEVTQGQWKKIMDFEPWSSSQLEDYQKEQFRAGNNYPAVNMLWTDAAEFCRRLSKRENKRYRLPTEAEWAYSCRAGSSARYSFGDDSSELSKYAWYNSFGISRNANLREVGTKPPNRWGIFDMHGNVSEWCADNFSDHPVGGRDPFFRQERAFNRTHRGGHYWSSASECRTAARQGVAENSGMMTLGFRVVLVPGKLN